jgi:O-antigen/teichoic acid export membrane protein
MKRFLGFIASNSFSSDALVSFASSTTARLITLAAVTAITRIYPAHEFGVWVLILAFANFLHPFCTFRLDLALVLAPTRRLANGLIAAVMAITAFTIVAIVVVFAIVPVGRIESLFSIEHAHASLLVFVPPLLLMIAFHNVLQMWLMRSASFRTIGLATIVHAFFTAAMIVALPSFTGATVGAIVAGSLIGYAASIITLYLKARLELVETAKMRAPLVTSLAAIRHYSVYPKFMFPQAVSAVFAERMIQFLLASLFSVGLLGAYFVARQSLLGPATILATSIRQVIFAHGARDVTIATTRQRTSNVLNILIMMIAPGLAWGIFWIIKIALLVFGPRWPELPILCWYCMFPAAIMIFTGPLDRLFDLSGDQRLSGTLQVSFDAFSVSVALLGVYFGASGIVLVGIISLSTVLYNMVWLIFALRAISMPLQEISHFFVRFLALFLSCCCLQYIASILPNPAMALICSIMILAVTGLFGFYTAARQMGFFRTMISSDGIPEKDGI